MDTLHESYKGLVEDLKGSSAVIGVFDGCHLGHMSLIDSCIEDASSNGRKSAIVTFDIDPDELFSAELHKIMSNSQRIEALSELGSDAVIGIRFDKESAAMKPIEFLDAFFGQNLPSSIHVGSDFLFGAKKAGDVELLGIWGRERGVEIYVKDLVGLNGIPIKSTEIRELLSKGEVECANALLGHPYTVCGPVTRGRGEGESFGFATANISATCILQEGVYAGYGAIDGIEYKAAISVGISPTFKDASTDALEAHLLGFEGDLYGKDVCVSFIESLRPMIKFASTQDLIEQVQSDIRYIQENL